MEISSVTALQSALRAAQAASEAAAKPAEPSSTATEKPFYAQGEQPQELRAPIEGKGRLLDIRV